MHNVNCIQFLFPWLTDKRDLFAGVFVLAVHLASVHVHSTVYTGNVGMWLRAQ